MFKFIGKALTSVVLTKEAQDAMKKARDSKPVAATSQRAAKSGKPAPAAPGKAAAVAQIQAGGKHLMTPGREALLKNAMKVRAAKKSIVGELSDEARANLVGITLIGLMRADQPTK